MSKIATWFATVFGAIALALLALKAEAKRKRARENEARAEQLLRSNVKTEIQHGEKLQAKAEADKAVAHKAEAKMEERLNEIAKNESLDAVADRFNSRRLRERTDDAAT